MTFKELQEVNKAIKTKNIKGKEYAEVNERVIAFRKIYPDGFIITDIVRCEDNFDNGGIITFTAKVGFYREDGSMQILGTGTALEKESASMINKTSYVENCETSAVGRALGMAGFGIGASIASAEEVASAIEQQSKKTAPKKAESAKCAACGAEVTDQKLIKATKEKYKKVICMDCINKKKAEIAKKKAEEMRTKAEEDASYAEMLAETRIKEMENTIGDARLPFPL